ncbi:twin-arginine translocation pathway signal precursor [Nonlabens ulvanivorans]|uniref:Twin-arginine translocation pathway signal n=1 Tax=Nonlabens ulvanivorans TaxID=906888 RepID=A0A090X225_NONUL|nr:twin-arginine translocation signal domain-containing protein [Nonlabens ulvanivorans]GAL74077.1 twin-arginine translocation pathway signal precursor [Nonlabens ulvanivorans]
MCDTHKKHQDPNSQAHHEEHEAWSRRTFLQALGIAGAGTFALGGAQISSAMASPITAALSSSTNDRVLVLIRLKGGNDGLNTIVPLNQYGTYASQRPNIALAQSSLYNLSTDYGLPSYMSSLQSRWGKWRDESCTWCRICRPGFITFQI